MALINVYYADVGEQGPRGGCGSHSEHRVVKDIIAVPGGERGTICYKGRAISVWRRPAWSYWTTRKSELDPPKAYYL